MVSLVPQMLLLKIWFVNYFQPLSSRDDENNEHQLGDI